MFENVFGNGDYAYVYVKLTSCLLPVEPADSRQEDQDGSTSWAWLPL